MSLNRTMELLRAIALGYSFQVGARKKLSRFMFFLEYNDGLENHLSGLALAKRSHGNRKHKSSSWRFGLARQHKVSDRSKFYWSSDWTYSHLSKNLSNYKTLIYYIERIQGWRFHFLTGFFHGFNSWLNIAGSLQTALFHDINKPFDGDHNETKTNLGFSLFYNGL